MQFINSCEHFVQFLTVNAEFALLACQIDLYEDVLYFAEFLRRLVDFTRKPQGVHRVNEVKLPHGVLHLIRLQMTDEVPFHLAC